MVEEEAKKVSEEPKEKEVYVKVVKDEKGEERVKVIEDKELVEQLHHEMTETEYVRKLILYSKIAAGVSIISLVIALTLLGLKATAEVISEEVLHSKSMVVSVLGFIVGLITFVLALQLDKKTKRKKKKTFKKKTKKRKKK